MSTIMRFNITDEVGVSAEININAEPAGPVDTIDNDYDVPLILIADGLTGTYTQDVNDLDSVVSNLEIATSGFIQ